jgi:hypothetical protein
MATRGPASLARWRRDAARKMKRSRRATLAFVKQLPADAMLEPRTLDSWSVKDVLGHLLSCDEETLRRFRLIARGRGDRIRWFRGLADADRFNARSVARTRRLGLATVLRRMTRARTELVEAFERLPLASLRDPAHEYPVVDWLRAPGWSHEEDHLSEVRAWWRTQARRRTGRSRARRPARA